MNFYVQNASVRGPRAALYLTASLLALVGVFAFAGSGDAAPVPFSEENGEPVNFEADTLVNDDANQMVIATGNVEFAQDGRVLKADEVRYDLTREVVTAHKNVILVDKNGDVHFSDQLVLENKMRDGYVQALRSTLADGSRFTAREGHRTDNGRLIVMKDATYTPCEPCKLHPEKSPTWQLRAKQVTHDDQAKTISYDSAWLEMFGLPVVYTPYFSHPDGSIKQKSGFLTPTLKLDSQNGTGVGTRYYWAIAPDRDATIGLQAYTAQAPRLTTEYRQRFNDAEINLNGSVTDSERKQKQGDETVTVGPELRGHLQGKGQWDMTQDWRSGFDFNIASDEQYFKQYDVSSEDVIENQIYAERFHDRNYASARLLAFEDLRTSTRATDQPNILPEVQANFLGDPGAMLGGRWELNASALGLQRSGSGADMARSTLEAGWEGRNISNFGLVTTLEASVRGDAYYSLDRSDAVTSSGEPIDKTLLRAFPMAQLTTSMPFVKGVKTVDLMFEPIAAVTVVNNMDQGKIPNEDSQDIQLDTSNLFESNRFPGYDRVEDLSRVTYGGRTALNFHDGSLAELFLGQSYRFDNEDNPFPVNSGLLNQQSDYVGRLKFRYRDYLTLDYGFQLGSENLQSVRHEVDNSITVGPVALTTRYLFAKEIDGIGVDQSREQIQSYGTYNLTDDWRVGAGANYDLGVDSGLRKTVFGVDYLGQCLTFSAQAQRNLTTDSSGESSTELMLRLGLKNLGEFQTSGISLSSGTGSSDSTQTIKGIPNGN